MSITEFEFDRRMRIAEAALLMNNGYTYGWVEPRQISAWSWMASQSMRNASYLGGRMSQEHSADTMSRVTFPYLHGSAAVG